MQRLNDKYGRGSAAVNGAGFVDLDPGDTFSGLEAKLRLVQAVIYENRMLGLRASIASRRNANELSKHMAPGEKEEAHKFAAKNVGALFARGVVGIRHFDKKAIRDDAPKPVMLRVFSAFVFADERMIATITLRQEKDGNKLYAIEALEINKDTDSERTPRGGTAPFQNQVSQLESRIAYYVGDVNRTKPAFIARSEAFSVETAVELVLNTVLHQLPTTNHQSPITNIAVIILIGQEKIHLKRCIEKLAPLNPRQIFLVESQPDDGGVAIAKETAAKLGLRLESKFNKWPGTQAVQFNWALDELVVVGSRSRTADGWILRLDADEYLDEKGIEWLKANLVSVPADVDVLEFTLERKFMGGVIRHATNGIKMVRMFRTGRAKYAETLMDERLIYEGKKIEVPVVFWDDNLNGLEWWKNKHRGYAKREAEQAIAGTFQDPRKASYYKLPRYLRAVMYFCIRYFLKGGFLDGKAGWMWNYWQGLWYRWIVDREISRRLKVGG